MADVRDPELAFLIGAARRAVERSSIRTVAAESGISHGGLHNLIAGDTRVIYGVTIKKLRAWYLREWAACGDGLTPEAAAYLVNQLVASIQDDGERHGAALELVSALERIYANSGTPRPAWLGAVGRELREERE
ncbi:MAG: hypothetical protein ACJ8GN_30725 [Longimicrobiaceae bacterium]